MDKHIFTNRHILAWLEYYSENADIDLEHVKLLDITRKNKNLIPMVKSHKAVMVFTEAGHPDIFYRMFNAGLGECTVIYNEGSDPAGPVKVNKIYDMINRGINAAAAMLIINDNAKRTIGFGMDNDLFAHGSVRYVCPEIRAIILSKMLIDEQKNLCIVTGESIAVEAANMCGEATVIAVEYNPKDRHTLEENVNRFGLHNIHILEKLDADSLDGLPVPDVAMIVASPLLDKELDVLLAVNPKMEFVIYTLEFTTAASLPALFADKGISDTDVIQIQVANLNAKNAFDIQPSPWLITGRAGTEE